MDNRNLNLQIVESTAALTDEMISQWRKLEESALEGNIYLSPDFILPSLHYLSSDINPVFIFVFEQDASRSKMVFAAIFEERRATLTSPFKILASYRNTHAFLSGVLVDSNVYKEALDTFFQYWAQQKRWQAMDLWWHWDNTQQSEKIRESAKRYNLNWTPIKRQERAAIFLEAETPPITKISKSLLKNVTKRRNQLVSLGELEFRYIFDKESTPRAIQTFMELEHQSWKGRNGTSLLSDPNQEKFFSNMTLTLAEREKVVFVEMLLAGRVIASTVNYISGDEFFAFKTARDESLDQYSPGILNEVALVEKIPETLSHIHIFDSGAETGSYMDNIWKDKLVLTSGYFTNNFWFRNFLRARDILRRFK